MTENKRARHYWLCESDLDGAEAVCGEQNESHNLHVIEHSAYEALRSELEAVRSYMTKYDGIVFGDNQRITELENDLAAWVKNKLKDVEEIEILKDEVTRWKKHYEAKTGVAEYACTELHKAESLLEKAAKAARKYSGHPIANEILAEITNEDGI